MWILQLQRLCESVDRIFLVSCVKAAVGDDLNVVDTPFGEPHAGVYYSQKQVCVDSASCSDNHSDSSSVCE